MSLCTGYYCMHTFWLRSHLLNTPHTCLQAGPGHSNALFSYWESTISSFVVSSWNTVVFKQMWVSPTRTLSVMGKQMRNNLNIQDCVCPHRLLHVIKGEGTRMHCKMTGKGDLHIVEGPLRMWQLSWDPKKRGQQWEEPSRQRGQHVQRTYTGAGLSEEGS